MARVQIRKKPGMPPDLRAENYDIQIDGKDIREVFPKTTHLSLELGAGDFPKLVVTSLIDDAEVDTEAEIEEDQELLDTRVLNDG